MTHSPRAPGAFELLVADLERSARELPRAPLGEAEAQLASLAARLAQVDRRTPVSATQLRRARRAFAAFSAAVSVLRANTDARLAALLHAARPPAGYDGAGRFASPLSASVRGAA
jgi:hypothetical protein